MGTEAEAESFALPGIDDELRTVVEEVGAFAYETVGEFVIDKLFVGYVREHTDIFLHDLAEDGFLVESHDEHGPYIWYRVSTEEERDNKE